MVYSDFEARDNLTPGLCWELEKGGRKHDSYDQKGLQLGFQDEGEKYGTERQMVGKAGKSPGKELFSAFSWWQEHRNMKPGL